MATNVAPGASWTGSNMKPASGEELDALWGQNVADNTGFLRARPLPIYGLPTSSLTATSFPPSGVDRTVAATAIFDQFIYRSVGHNTLVATVYATNYHGGATTPDCYGTMEFGLYGDLGTFLNTDKYVQNNTNNYTKGSTYIFSLALSSYVSEGSWARIIYKSEGSSRDLGGSDTIDLNFSFGTVLAYTVWI